MKRILILLLALCSLKTMAQYPVSSISITLPPQPKPNTGDWAMPFVITAQAKLVNGQVLGYLTESRILVTIKKGGTKFCGSYTQTTAPVSMFNSPVKTWSGGVAIGLIGANCVLPPGSYELCVQFFSNNPAVSVPMPYSSEVCKTFTIAEPQKITYSPPQNVMPVDGKVFTKQEANLPIMFRWTPVLPKPKEDVIYKVRLYEVVKGTSKAQAIKSGSPVETIEVKNITQASFKLAPRCNNCEWVWNVEASKKSQLGDIERLGTSEGSSFRINPSPNSPLDICNDATVSNTQIDCQGFVNGAAVYFILDQISNNSGKNIISWTLTSSAGTFNNTGPQSIPKNSSVNTQAIGLTNAVPDASHFVFATYTFTFDDNSTCTIGMDYLLPDCNPPCACGQWSNIRFNTTNASGGPISFTASCVSGNDTISIRPNANFTINPGYNCTGNNCLASFKYDVFYQNEVKLYDNVEASVIDPSEMNTCGEVYKIVIKPTCNGQSCLPCTTYFKRNCPPVCQCTNHPTVVKRTVINGTVQEIPFSCTEPAPYIDKLKCNGNDTIIVKNFCTGTCPAQSASLSIKRPDGTTFIQPVWSTAPGEVWFLLPPSNQNGIYSFTFSTNCGNQTCTNCKIDFQQNCPPGCYCGSWGSVTLHPQPAGTMPDIVKNCNDTFAIPHDMYFYFSGFNCIGNPGTPYYCSANYKYDVFKLNGTQIFFDITTLNAMDVNDCNEVYKIILKPQCKTLSCPPCTVYLKRTCDPSCTCGSWTNTKLSYTFNSASVTDKPVTNGETIIVDCKKSVTVKWNYNCTGQCPPTTTVAIYPPGGGRPVGMVGGFSIPFAPTIVTGEPYKVVLTATCDGNVCDSFIIYVTPKCDPPSCECGIWSNPTVNGIKYACGANIPWKCNTPATFNASYQCNPNDATCLAAIDWAIKNDNTNTIIKTGNGISNVTENFTPTANGSYTIYFNAVCGTKKCPPPCKITLVVNDCVDCRCDQFYFTGTVAPGNNGLTASGSIDISGLPPVYGIEMQVQSYGYSANPAACTNGVSSIERSGVFLQQGTTINGLPVALLNETVSGLTTTNNGISKNIKLLSNSAFPLNVLVSLNLGLPAPIDGLPASCCRISYQLCIKIKVYYDKASCKSCVLTYCFPAFTN